MEEPPNIDVDDMQDVNPEPAAPQPTKALAIKVRRSRRGRPSSDDGGSDG
ncbi:Uu.00g055540.m01.CDS01 [Anthostomella pinea]|uniref:Uu.00g055540.m01.CDS01 n=1 Tax=Anthostomella pinea TaxID=933095 RepID=A0AAI8VXI7_9PEZI|nr:Uu.00g055540.m01.CDS01 [Anthostomella pinea]